MATRLQLISELSKETYKQLPNYENWTSFLRTAAWQYKYSFADQLLIHAQRPNAKACASIELWNNKLRRWVNKGAKGIALLREKENKYYLDYVFDIADTNSFYGNEVKLWEYNPKYENAVKETLENTFGEPWVDTTIVDAVMSAATNAVLDNKADYLAELKYAKENSFLEDLDELNLDKIFQEVAENSIGYLMLQRLGFDADDYYVFEDFMGIVDFNTPEAMTLLGNAVSSISEQALREIAETIRAEARKERQQQRFFAKSQNAEYNIDREETINANKSEEERTIDYGRNDDNLQAGGRILDTQPRSADDGQTDRQIRNDEENLSDEEPQQPIHSDEITGDADGTLGGNRHGSETTSRADSVEDGTGGEHHGGTESERPIEVDRTYEQPFTFSGRNRDYGGGQQLSLFPLISEQQDIIREAERRTFGSAFSVSQQIIDEMLASGGNGKDSVLKICVEFSKNKSLADKVEFLKKEYETGGKGFVFQGVNISFWWNDDGIRFSQGKSARTSDEYISWEEATKRIDELLELGRYVPQETLDRMEDFELDRAAKAFWYMHKDVNYDDFPALRNVFEDNWFKGGYDESISKIKSLLKTKNGYEGLKISLAVLYEAYEKNSDVMRFRLYAPTNVMPLFEDLQIPRKEYTTEIDKTFPERFITNDEIDQILKGGSNVQDGKFRIYRFFTEHSDPKERLDFVKNEYGWSGSYGATYSKDTQSKHFTISRADILSPFGKVEMKWQDVVKRIDTLIKNDNYLTDEEKTKSYPAYIEKQRQLEEAARIRKNRIEYLNNQDELTSEELKATLPKRLFYYFETIDNNDKFKLEKFGLADLIDANELYIADVIKDPDVKRRLMEALNHIQMSTIHAHARSNAYRFQNELAELKTLLIEETMEAYTIRGIYAEEIKELLNLPDESFSVADNGLPAVTFSLYDGEEFHFDTLSENGYQFVIHNDEELSVLQRFFAASKADDISVGYVGSRLIAEDGENVWENEAIYNFIVNEMLSFDENENLIEGFDYDTELIDAIKYYTSQYGVPIEPVLHNWELTFPEYYHKIHAENGEKTVALFPMGDFYEAYSTDAEEVAEALNIALTNRKVEGETLSMCGFPKHTLDRYIRILNENGYDVLLTDDKRGYVKYPKTTVEQPTGEKQYDIGYGLLGNGVTVWNRLEEVDNDYKIIAHISVEGDVSYREELPDHIKEQIESAAAREKADYKKKQLEDKAYRVSSEDLQKAYEAYNAAKEQDPDCIIIMDFRTHTEVYGEDAEIASKIWDTPILSRKVAGFTETGISMTGITNIENVVKSMEQLRDNGHDVILYTRFTDGTFFKDFRISSHDTIQKRMAEMTDDEKESHIGLIEHKQDYGETNITADDYALYNALIEEREKAQEVTAEEITDELPITRANLDAQLEAVANCIGYDDFKADIERLWNDQHGDSLVGILSTAWLKSIINTPTDELAKYVNEYIPDTLNAYKHLPNGDDEPLQDYRQVENMTRYVGTEITIDDRKFIVDEVNEISGRVSLKDVTFQNSTGFPIFRSESVEWLKYVLEKQAQKIDTFDDINTEEVKANLADAGIVDGQVVDPEALEQSPFIQQVNEDVPLKAAEKAKTEKVRNEVVYPDIPMSERSNFTIENDELGYGTASEKFAANVAAIRLLKTLESEERLATPEEQEILSNYVGWGGLPDVFEEKHSKYQELRSLLTDEEYEQARASTLNAHYTSPTVIKAMYKALENMGFKQGNILEPSCGIGNFMGLVPDSMSESKMYGIEIDSITGRIAQQLYQKNSVAIQGFEDTTLPDSFFDVAIGNVPFGNYKIPDKRYNKHNFFIHDYFFAKTLDKVRPGGIVAFITSMGTMDKKNSAVRKYIAQRADLLGAIRLPNNAFLKNAGTQVTADILFLQKRDRMTDIMPEWVELGTLENGLTVNQYFVDNPDMILGEMTEESSQYGQSITCKPYEDADLSEQVNDAIQNIHAQITEFEFDEIAEDEEITIPADPNVKNFSYTIVDGDVYFRENSIMHKVELNATAENRIKGLIEIRDCVRELIEYQTEGYPDYDIKKQQEKLSTLYDKYTHKYGLINSRGNSLAFSDDSSYFLLCSLEVIGENGELQRKADIFTKRTIGAKREITKVDTSSEALAVSLAEKAKVDMDFMMSLTGKTEDEIYEELKGVIFINPHYEENNIYEPAYLTADEYLSGNVRTKLSVVKSLAYHDEAFKINVEALEKVQPKDLTAAEISVKLGTTWIPQEYVEQFTYELLDTSLNARSHIKVRYYPATAEWNVSEKSYDRHNIRATNTYGTHRANAYRIIEDTLNQRDVRIFDYKYDAEGKKVPELNVKETAIAQQKQETIKQAFVDWIWKDPTRRDELCKLYNERFNSNRPREYDGSHITFSGINPEIQLRKHQKDAVARVMYGGNSLLGHVVGAGKTWTMVAAAMESKRLGLCNKSLFVVPNHLTEQWASEFLQLYPAANVLVATKKDFETKNRKKFCGRIATGEYDAIIIGHSQFEKIPMSNERQIQIIREQISEVMLGIGLAKAQKAENFTIKQMEKTKRNLEARLDKLNDQSRKDDIVTFEELGVDRVFVDEAHYYKNLFLYTKMRNVGGISQTEAQKSSDLYMKSKYLDEITGGKGLIFATGTPISNSMVELYTMQRYLQYGALSERQLQHFDAWASTYGETVTAIELAPEGTGYRAKTRFAKFFNLPEVMTMFKEVADIQTADMLNLPVPEVEYHTVAVDASEIQKKFVAECGERAEKVRNGGVDPHIDNMLRITNEGRKIALDQRMINPMFPDEENSKVNQCVSNVHRIWEETADKKSAQLIFCDMSTPKTDGTFSVYNDIRDKLIKLGVPENEIAFIHNADTEARKKELFAKVRSGDVRILLGSTSKMGAGTNVQKRLIASHDLDCPWRPADLEQRAGRIIRQGNENEKVHIYRYVTKDTFDSYMWQTVENKQKFISQIMTSKSPVRSAEDIDETALSYAEIKALATGNPHIKEKMELDTEVAKLKMIKSSYQNEIYSLEDKIIKYYPQRIAELTQDLQGNQADLEVVKQHPKQEDKFNPMTIDGVQYTEKKDAGEALIERCKKLTNTDPVEIGNYRGFAITIYIDEGSKTICLELKSALSHTVELGSDIFGNIQRMDNALDGIESTATRISEVLEETKKQFEVAKIESKKEFPQEAELNEKLKRLATLDALLNMNKRSNDGVAMGEPDENELPQKKKHREMER